MTQKQIRVSKNKTNKQKNTPNHHHQQQQQNKQNPPKHHVSSTKIIVLSGGKQTWIVYTLGGKTSPAKLVLHCYVHCTETVVSNEAIAQPIMMDI